MTRFNDLLVLAIVLATTTTLFAQDPVLWSVEDGGNGHWYQGISMQVSWNEARQLVNEEGGYLATPTTEAEHLFIDEMILSQQTDLWYLSWGPWIGGYQDVDAPDYEEPAGGWRWLTGEPFDWAEWGDCHPDNHGGNQTVLAYGLCSIGSERSFNDGNPDDNLINTPSYLIEWSADCNGDGIVDYGQILDGTFVDEDGNGVPDICELIIVEPGESIQAAIDIVSVGGIVQLLPGTHRPGAAIDFNGKSCTLESQAGADTTILDGEQLHRGLMIARGEENVLIQGIRITGCVNEEDTEVDGVPTFLLRNGAGLLVVNSTVTIRDCILDTNVSARSGGGLYAWNAVVTIESTRIEGNDATNTGGGCAFFDTQASLSDVILDTNTSASTKGGGGMIYSGSEVDCTLTLNQCTLLGNASTFSGEVDGTHYEATGGALYSNNASGTGRTVTINLADSTFTENTAAGTGGAIWMNNEINCSIAGSLICDNTSEQIVGVYEDVSANCITDVCDSDDDGTLDCNDPCPYWPGDCSEDGQTIYVAPGESIQAAIDVCPSGGTIEVAAGMFQPTTTLDPGGKAFTLRGATDGFNGTPTTILDGQDSIRLLQCTSGEGLSTIFENLVIANGSATRAGGMYIDGSSPSLLNCTFLSNHAEEQGGGIYNNNSNAVVTSCEFRENSADFGGAIFNGDSPIELSSCVFVDNDALNTGGGVHNYHSDVTITDCEFRGNTANNVGCYECEGGGGLHNQSSSPHISSSILCSNTPDQINNSHGGSWTDNGGNCITDVCDSDGDETLDCNDGCPDDPYKTDPGQCGCGVPDTDTDGDGTADCIDPCPEWPGNCSEDGQTIYVALDESIQAAISIVPDGGTIEVAEGTFPLTGPLDPGGRAMTIRGPTDVDGNPTAILDGQDSTRVLICQSGETVETLFENLVITRGNAGDALRGGGMYCYQSSPSIINCTFLLNHAEQGGGALYNEDHSSPQLSGCFFSRNSTEVDGGAVFNYLSSSPAFTACTFSENTGRLGGALANQDDADCSFTNCLFVSNSADPYTSPAHGGAIFNNSSDPQIMNCTFTDNHAESDGGAIYNMGDSIISIDDSVFTGNVAETQGHAIANTLGGTTEITNSNICDNGAQVVAIDGGHDHSIALLSNGRVVCWGSDQFGQSSVPEDLFNPSNPVVEVFAGGWHSIALHEDGTLSSWGDDFYNQSPPPVELTDGSARVVDVDTGDHHNIALLDDGTIRVWGEGQDDIPASAQDPANPVVGCAAGGYFSMAVLQNGDIAIWGKNAHGQHDIPEGIGSSGLRVIDAAGAFHVVALLEDGSIACWGRDAQGQTNIPDGVGEPGNRVTQVFTTGFYSFVVLEDNTMVGWGNTSPEGIPCPCPIPEAVANPDQPHALIADGAYHVLAVLADGEVVAWGWNATGQTDFPAWFNDTEQISGGYNDLGGNCIREDCGNDLDENGIPDGCDPDCDGDGEPDAYEISSGQDTDCNTNSIPDTCEIADGSVEDCNDNGFPDSCDIAGGFDEDVNNNGIPDACELATGDLNLDGCIDGADLAMLLAVWGSTNPPFGDLDGDGLVNGADLTRLLGAWGGCG